MGMSLRKVAAEFSCCHLFFCDLPEVDITNRITVEAYVIANHIDAIVNCAAYTAVDRAEDEPDVAESVNVDGAGTVAQVAVKHGLKLVHVSTDFVFDGRSGRPLTETDVANPLNVYGRTKLEGELAVRESGADAVVVRTSWLYSEYGSNFVKTMLGLADRGSVEVVNDQIGSPTYATDLARSILELLGRDINGFDIYNYSNEGSVSRYEFAKEIFRLAGMEVIVKPITSEQFPMAAERPANSSLDLSKAIALGLSVRGWKTALEECINNMQA